MEANKKQNHNNSSVSYANKSTRSQHKNQVSNLPVQGSQKPTIISDLCFHIKLPNGIPNYQKISHLQITQQNTASNSATISATKLKFFLIFFVFSEEFSVKTKHFHGSSVIKKDHNKNPSTMHCNAKVSPLLMGRV